MTRVYLHVALLVLCLWAASDRASASSEAEPQSPDSAFQDFNKYKVLAKNGDVEHRQIQPATLLSKRLSNGDKQGNSTEAFNSLTQSVALGPVTVYTKEHNRACTFPFFYHGKGYHSCTLVNYHRPWCSYDYTYVGNWGSCKTKIKSVSNIPVLPIGRFECQFPFYTVWWGRKTYHHGCHIGKGPEYKAFCSTNGAYNNPNYQYRECDYRGLQVTTIRGYRCKFPFSYFGVTYYACTGRRSPGREGEENRPWCQFDEGPGRQGWDYCQIVTTQWSKDGFLGIELIANASQAEPKIPTTYLMPKQSEQSGLNESPPRVSKLDIEDRDLEDVDLEDLPPKKICAKILQGDIKDYEKDALRLQNEGVDFIQKCKAANYPEDPEGKINLVKVPSPSGEQRNELWYM